MVARLSAGGAAGGYLLVDGAQLVPHRKVRMGRPDDAGSIDFLAYSAHKMYAPFGIGVLVAATGATVYLVWRRRRKETPVDLLPVASQ
jgi:selenocysteine lyase/cysteine desulfurase